MAYNLGKVDEKIYEYTKNVLPQKCLMENLFKTFDFLPPASCNYSSFFFLSFQKIILTHSEKKNVGDDGFVHLFKIIFGVG